VLHAELSDCPNVDLQFGDALKLDLASLEPAPTKLVANLPYNVATPLVAESLDGLPSVQLGA
jgi:16S rRNA (adenine1518-N6/adenine1519-N6)-dimethyltransferase